MKQTYSRSAIRTAHRVLFVLVTSALALSPAHLNLSTFVFAAVAPTITIDSITDVTGEHFPSFNFSCDADPLFGDVSVAGSGTGSAPPGQIEQYGVEVDWGDAVLNNSTDDPGIVVFAATPPSGQSDFTFTYDAGPHTYASAGSYVIHTRMYHVNPSGNDATADVSITVDTCVVVIPPGSGIVNVTKIVDGGTKSADDFSAILTSNGDAGDAFALSGDAIPVEVEEGTYSIDEVADAEYTTEYSDGCSGDIAENDVIDCTITNTVVPVTLGSLTISKVVVNDDTGSAAPDDFSFVISPAIDEDGDTIVDDGILTIPTGESSVTFQNIPDGQYSIVEVAQDGYSFSSGSGTNCSFDGETATATVASGSPATDASCEFTNDDDPVIVLNGFLIVNKIVVNDDGGEGSVNDFPLFVDGSPVVSGDTSTLPAGTYTVTESGNAGYTGTFSGDCDENGQVTVSVDQTSTCTLTNDDNDVVVDPDPDPTTGSLTVTKVVINDDNGEGSVSSFPLFVGETQVTSGESNEFDPGSYVVSETNASGYTASFSGDCDENGNVTLEAGDALTCTITNDDIPSSNDDDDDDDADNDEEIGDDDTNNNNDDDDDRRGGGGGSCGTCGHRPDNGDSSDDSTPDDTQTPPAGEVLGETDEQPADPGVPDPGPEPEVLGATDALPTTGIPAWFVLLLVLPILWATKRDA
jgi:hypothetical protein